ncbi:MAG: energy-coupling factor ABC transporter ATP-binding protein, partial [Methylocystaceae bacterium]
GYGLSGSGINDISLEIKSGEIVAVLGMNGSGKTTLGRALGGLLPVHSGVILIDDQALSPEDLRSRVTYLFSPVQGQFIGNTIEEDILFGLECRRLNAQEIAERLERTLASFDLMLLRERKWQQLSEGELQRAALAAVLALEPDYLILDEPTATLDHATTQQLYQLLAKLKNQGRGLVVLTNQIEEAARADRVVIMSEGTVVASGLPRQVLADDDLQSRPFKAVAFQVAQALVDQGLRLGDGTLDTEGLVDAIWHWWGRS